MKIAISTDEYYPIIEILLKEVQKSGHEVIYFGPKENEKPQDWTTITLKAMKALQAGQAEEGIVLCWTGTGCTLIANKCLGIRAALCIDGETAKGARTWNHANVLGLSLRLITPILLKDILDAWFSTPFSRDSWNLSQIEAINQIESQNETHF
ncbi:MAG: RpiB/LacA/LacB family sugar-phosphate isomerase [Simkaniaceae bacterium]|nr:MAG: RpiB/LacA/LacB family sugar-phosphate isomerase [Simkaniaceae bacterium]